MPAASLTSGGQVTRTASASFGRGRTTTSAGWRCDGCDVRWEEFVVRRGWTRVTRRWKAGLVWFVARSSASASARRPIHHSDDGVSYYMGLAYGCSSLRVSCPLLRSARSPSSSIPKKGDLRDQNASVGTKSKLKTMKYLFDIIWQRHEAHDGPSMA